MVLSWFSENKRSSIVLLLFTLCCYFLPDVAIAKKPQAYIFNITSQSIDTAAEALAKQTDTLLLFNYDHALSVVANPVVGTYSVKEALDLMLLNTGLLGSLTNKGVITISMEGSLKKTNKSNRMKTKKISSFFNKLAIITASIFGAGAVTSSTHAEEGNSFALEEIIVTAQKREQSINDVGLSITAVTGQALENAGIYDVGDLAKIVPGLTFSSSLNNTTQITLRGIGFNEFTLGSSPTVSVYSDQVAIPFLPMTRGATLDLERVEVLKGPQGILFGQNSTGGAINYIAAKPTEEFEAGINASFGRFDETHLGGYVSGQLSDQLTARFALRTTQSGDWQKSYTRSDSNGSEDFTTGRFLLNWTPSDSTNILLNINGWKDKSDSTETQLVGFRLQRPDVISRTSIITTLPLAPNNARAADWNPAYDLSHDDDYLQISLRADVDLSNELTLTSITSYDDYSQAYSFDRDGSVLRLIDTESNDGSIENFSQELRLAGDSETLHWVIGGNYSDASTKNVTSIRVGDSSNTLVFGIPFDEANQIANHEIEEYAFFGNVDYSLNDTVTLSGGLRYTNNTKDFEGCTTGDAGISTIQTLVSNVAITGSPFGTATPLIMPGQCVTLDGKTFVPTGLVKDTLEEDNLSWRVGINYEPDNNKLFYLNATKGFKSGSFPVLSSPVSTQLIPVTQEELLAYEAGFKISMENAPVQLNGAIFHYDYTDKQVRGNVLVPIFVTLEALVNVPEAHVTGAELQLLASPMDGLTLNLSATYLDTEIDEFVGLDFRGNEVNLAGSSIPFTPEFQATADIEYRFSAGSNLEAFIGGNLVYNDDTNSLISAPDAGKIKSFAVLDLRAGIGAVDGKWTVGIYGRNVTDEFYWNNAFPSQDVIVRFAAKPVTYGIKFDYVF